jgi:hypothetical protein
MIFLLTREPHVRADLIRQFYQRPDGRDIGRGLDGIPSARR